MARLYVPPQLRDSTRGLEFVEGPFETAASALEDLRQQFPEAAERLLQADGRLAPGWAVVVDGVAAPLGLRAPLTPGSEVHILPALGGG